VGEHDRVVIDVNDMAFRGKRLRDFVHVLTGGQARVDVRGTGPFESPLRLNSEIHAAV
jgi:hypothetical protein